MRRGRRTLLVSTIAAGCGGSGPTLPSRVLDAGAPTESDGAADAAEPEVGAKAGDACNAPSWAVVPVPPEAATDSFVSVAATSPADVWACSGTGSPPAAAAVHLLHWDGTVLSEAPLPVACFSLWTSAPGDVWAGGEPHRVGHLVNGSWAEVNLLDQRSAFAIWGSGPASVWFVGVNYWGGHWNGSALAMSAVSQPATSVWGTADDDLWMIDGDSARTPPVSTSMFHVNEATSRVDVQMPSPSMSTNLTGIWAADDAHVWVVGSAGSIGFFDGVSWSSQASPTTRDLAAVWGSSTTDVWAVGTAGTIVHWDGSSWSLDASPVQTNLVALTGTGRCNVWAVGEAGRVIARR